MTRSLHGHRRHGPLKTGRRSLGAVVAAARSSVVGPGRDAATTTGRTMPGPSWHADGRPDRTARDGVVSAPVTAR